jgi:hypothetical protein
MRSNRGLLSLLAIRFFASANVDVTDDTFAG